MDTPQNEVVVDEELGKDYNPEDIIFIDDDSESDR